MPRYLFLSIMSYLFLFGAWTAAAAAPQRVSFLQMCLEREKLNPAQQYTLNLLLKFAKAANCEQGAIHLESVKSLTLMDKGIEDVSPIGTLRNLMELNLMSNQIRDLRPLRGLDQLQTLNLSENRIENVEAISALITLKKLWLDSNEIFDIGPVEANVNLVLLSINDNRVNNVAGLRRLWKLKHVSHWGNPIKTPEQIYSVLRP